MPAIVAAPLLLAAPRQRPLRATLRPFRLLYALLAGGAAARARRAGSRAAARSTDLLGAYSVVGERRLRRRRRSRASSSTTSPSSTSTSASSRSPRSCCSSLLARRLDAGRWRRSSPPGSRSSVSVLLVVAAFASRVREPDPGAEHLRRRAVLPDRAARLGRPRAAAAALAVPSAAAVAAALLPLAIPFERVHRDGRDLGHARAAADLGGRTARCSSTRSTATVLRRRASLAAALFLFVPRRWALALPAVVARSSSLAVSYNVWFGEHGFRQASAGRALPGHPGRRRATGSTARVPDGRQRGVRLDRRHRPLRRQPERVLQPQRSGRSTSSAGRRRAGLRRRRCAIDESTGAIRTAARRAASTRATCSPRTRSRPTASCRPRPRHRPHALARRRRRSSRRRRRSTAATRTTRGPGRTVTWTRERCRGGTLDASRSRATRSSSTATRS